jgi:hypothetical protein
MRIGEANRKHQELVCKTDARSTTHPFARIWVMRCRDCGHKYGCNSCDAHIRRCPYCCPRAARGEPI